MKKKILRILFLEDDPADLELMQRELHKGGLVFQARQVQERVDFLAAIKDFSPDIILADANLPSLDGVTAISLARKVNPDIPLILVSGALGEENAVEFLKSGVTDYVIKGRISRLLPAVQRALQEVKVLKAQRQSKKRLKSTERRYALLFDKSADAIFVYGLTADGLPGRFIEVNEVACRRLGYHHDEMLQMSPRDIEGKENKARVPDLMKRLAEHKQVAFETEHLTRIGRRIPVEIDSRLFEIDGQPTVLSTARDITERKLAEKRQAVFMEMLRQLNQPEERQYLVENILRTVKEYTGFEAAAIRLREDDDYPFYCHSGFPGSFIEDERYLCARDRNGGIVRDREGRACLACICGQVLFSGTSERFRSFLTEAGSFWSNSIGQFMASTPPDELPKGLRGRCYKEGYETVAYIPLKSGGEIFGLLQLNDRRRGLLDEERVRFLEGLAASIGIALKRIKLAEEFKNLSQFNSEVISSALGGIIVYDRELRYRVWNRFMENLTGRTAAEVIGKSALDVFPHLRQLGVDKLLRQALAGNYTSIAEATYPSPEGQITYYTGRYGPHRNAKGEIVGVIGVLTDITERRKMEAALKAGEEKYRDIFENAVEGIYQTTPAGAYLAVNPAFARMFGFASSREMMDEITDIGDRLYVNPADRVRLAGLLVKHGRVEGYEAQMRHKDGHQFWISINAHVVRNAEGAILFFEGTNEDITERKKAEETLRESEGLFRSLMEGMIEATVILDWDGRILFANNAGFALMGISQADLSGLNIREFIQPDSQAVVFRDIALVKENKGGFLAEYRIRTRKGEEKWVETLGTRIKFRSSWVALITLRDVTERKILQEKVVQAEKLAALGELISGVAHEINNPLTGMVGFAELLAQETSGLKEEQRQEVEMIYSEALRIKKIVSSLLSFARKQKLGKGKVLITEVLEQVLEVLAYQLKVNNVRVEHDFAPEKLPVYANASQLMQVVLNIITNAQQAMKEIPEHNGLIRLRTYRKDNRVFTEIADNGPGIKPENLAKIFDPFFTTKKEGKGTGLGLSLSYGIVKEHQGDLSVASELGKGTKFIMELPIFTGEGDEQGKDTGG